MKVFISWSGQTSHNVALAIRDWLPCVLNEAKPFVSSEDIRKGNRWLLDVSKELATTRFGIICLTADNLNAPWILFEAGALSKSLKDSQVCTLLLGQLKPTDVKGPLAGFQHTIFGPEDFKKLVAAINNEVEQSQLSEMVITKVFNKWWPDLESNVTRILTSNSVPAPEERSESDILKEILELTRYVARNTKEAIEDDPDFDKLRQLLNFPTKELDFSQPTQKKLDRLGLTTVAALSTRTESELAKGGISKAVINEIQKHLSRLGLSLGMTFDDRLVRPPMSYKRV
jgi:hypothetical protein